MLEHAVPVLLDALQMPLSPRRLRRIPALGAASVAKFAEKNQECIERLERSSGHAEAESENQEEIK